MRTTIIAASIVGLVVAGPVWASEHPEHPKADAAATTGKAALDGKVFVGSMGKAGAPTGDQDQLTFKKGTFLSAACVRYGFKEAPYTTEEKDGVVTFTASPKNAKGETARWTRRRSTRRPVARQRTGSRVRPDRKRRTRRSPSTPSIPSRPARVG